MVGTYQSFHGAKGSSNSFAKLEKLRFPNLVGKRFLDVGCNEGFFCAAAYAAGAAQVVGMDSNRHFYELARSRFPWLEFRHQSWDEPIEGRYDVILLASAIHYAKDQPALIYKLLDLLAPGGTLVLELGIASGSKTDMVTIKRPVGDTRDFFTRAGLHASLPDCSIRDCGPSVMQSGDETRRFVFHITRIQPTVLLLAGPSQAGKSTLARLLGANRYDFSNKSAVFFSLDAFLTNPLTLTPPAPDLDAAFAATLAARQAAIARVGAATDRISDALHAEGHFLKLIDYLARRLRRIAPLAVWDGFVRPSLVDEVAAVFQDNGYVVWSAERQLATITPIATITNAVLKTSSGPLFRSREDIALELKRAEAPGTDASLLTLTVTRGTVDFPAATQLFAPTGADGSLEPCAQQTITWQDDRNATISIVGDIPAGLTVVAFDNRGAVTTATLE